MENLKNIVSEFLKEQGFEQAIFSFDDVDDKNVTFITNEIEKVNKLSLGSGFTKSGTELDVISKFEDDDNENDKTFTWITVKLYNENDFHRNMF